MDSALQEGVRLFNARHFFEAHEALEILWLKTAGEEKNFLHGLIQVAAAFHHLTRNNPAGFRSLLEKGSLKLEKSAGARGGIRVGEFLAQLRPWREWADRAAQPRSGAAGKENGGDRPPFPEVRC